MSKWWLWLLLAVSSFTGCYLLAIGAFDIRDATNWLGFAKGLFLFVVGVIVFLDGFAQFGKAATGDKSIITFNRITCDACGAETRDPPTSEWLTIHVCRPIDQTQTRSVESSFDFCPKCAPAIRERMAAMNWVEGTRA